MRYLTKRLDSAVVVEPKQQQRLTQVFFGATVTYAKADGSEHTVTLVGVDEADFRGKISWRSPIAQALMKAKVDDACASARRRNRRDRGGRDPLRIAPDRYARAEAGKSETTFLRIVISL